MGLVLPDLLGSKGGESVKAPGRLGSAKAEAGIFAGAGDQLGAIAGGVQAGAVAETAIESQHQQLGGPPGLIQRLAQGGHALDKTLREVMELAHFFIFLPSLRIRLARRFFQRRRLFKAHGQSATTGVGTTVQGEQQRGLEEAQAAHQVDMKGRREGIAMIARLGNSAAGLAQAGVVDSDAHQAAGTIGQGATPHARKQGLWFPATTRVEKVLARPTVLLAALSPDDARQTAPAHADQGAQGLAHGAAYGALLRKTGVPIRHDLRPGGQQSHGTSARKAKVFLAGRRNRSPRATFLLSEETRLSRSTLT